MRPLLIMIASSRTSFPMGNSVCHGFLPITFYTKYKSQGTGNWTWPESGASLLRLNVRSYGSGEELELQLLERQPPGSKMAVVQRTE